jgi:hypothetical protein
MLSLAAAGSNGLLLQAGGPGCPCGSKSVTYAQCMLQRLVHLPVLQLLRWLQLHLCTLLLLQAG